MIDTIRLSEKAKGQLITLKRKTGLQNWNVLCRWAFCVSLAEPSVPPHEDVPADSSVEMTWRTFTGGHEGVYWALFLSRAKRDGIPDSRDRLNEHFRLHLHRGISYLNSSTSIRDAAGLLRLSVEHQISSHKLTLWVGRINKMTCPFCDLGGRRSIAASEHAIAVPDKYPVSEGHVLVVPRRHVASIFDLDATEYQEVWELVAVVERLHRLHLGDVGLNVGVNDGRTAGQTVAHAHVHIIPRYVGDVTDPRGGVRWVLPERAKYWNK